MATDQFASWYHDLDAGAADAVGAAVDVLAEQGPTLARPLVDRIAGSSLHNLKELRVTASGGRRLRVLFIFDPRSSAVLLLGGDKTGRWQDWYRRAIPQAEDLYAVYLEEISQQKEGP